MTSNRFMKNADDDNDEFPFQSLAAITAKLLQAQKTEDSEAPGGRSGGAQQDHGGADHTQDNERCESEPEQHRQYVDQRLREIAAFEARARGARKRR